MKLNNTFRNNPKYFSDFKSKYPNIYALYLTASRVCVWSGIWYFLDSISSTPDINLSVTGRHFLLLFIGIFILYVDDNSLEELVLMRKYFSLNTVKFISYKKKSFYISNRKKFFCFFKTKYPHWATIYTVFGIVLTWYGIWGLIWGVPVHPYLRSASTIFIGFFSLFLVNKLDEF
ncbi:hypothetical protein CEN46_01600 [Fischerella thermalis CCMEE 5318]|uniref:Uncharacterized protein n=1 Tax=Fischerella thermalis CCMEE 5318 TaxID=2019666 RepID=A0A2N6LNW7_9CYAN|nr:hypothetical protein CEN46_01600 [Fischerella thermalis CCMEE 5318]